MAQEKHWAFFSNRECEYFPCHQTEDSENFNCLFCYCPLYVLGSDCGGDYVILPNGVKDCSGCIFPHKAENYDGILERYGEIQTAMKYLEMSRNNRKDETT